MCLFAHFLRHLLADFSKVRAGNQQRRVTSRRSTPLGDPRGIPKLLPRAITKRYIKRTSEHQPDLLEGSRVRILINKNYQSCTSCCHTGDEADPCSCSCQPASKRQLQLLAVKMDFNFELSGTYNVLMSVPCRVHILDGNSEIGAHVRSNLCYFICLRHLIRSRAVTYRIFFLRTNVLSEFPSNTYVSWLIA